MRWRTFCAVACLFVQMGSSTAITSAVVIPSMSFPPSCGQAYSRSVVCQLSAFLPPAFHAALWMASTVATASSKVGTPGARRAAGRGSPPERATRRLARARSRASASGTREKLPRPSAQAFRWMTSRWTQRLACWFVVLTRLPPLDWGYVLPAVVFGNLVMVNFYFVAGLGLLEKGASRSGQVPSLDSTLRTSRPVT